MKTGRDVEVFEIVQHDRAVEVALLLMGRLNGGMKPIFPEEYHSLPRKQLKSGKASLRDGRADEVRKFCKDNFVKSDVGRLAGLYEELFEHDSELRLPLQDFEKRFGQLNKRALGGAPRHCTIVISPWGLQTEYPEMHFARDMVIAFNAAFTLDAEIKEYGEITYAEAKQDEVRHPLFERISQARLNRRTCVLSCCNLLEAYINGIAWDCVHSDGLSDLSNEQQVKLEKFDKLSLVKKLKEVPEVVTGRSPGPLAEDADPLKSFKESIKPYRDSFVHAAPFSAEAKYHSGYDKLSKVYDLTLETTRTAVNITLDIIMKIHLFVGGDGERPKWLPAPDTNGKFQVC